MSVRSHRRLAGVAALVVSMALVAGGCSSTAPPVVTVTEEEPAQTLPIDAPGLPGTTLNTSLPEASNTQAGVRSTMRPKDGAKDVPPNDPVTLTVFSAKLDSVTMKADDGTEIAGELSADKTKWTSSERLDYGTAYTLAGTAKGDDGKEVPVGGKLTTVKPAKMMGTQFNIPAGSKVGIAAPIIITFMGQVANRAAAEKAVVVTTSAGAKVEGNWGWVQDEDFQNFGYKQSQMHWRPTKSSYPGPTPYWPAGTTVTVTANLKGVNFGAGVWGKEDFTRSFTIRPDARVVQADASTYRLRVIVNGKVSKNYAVSYGKESSPGRATRTGVHIVQEKYPVKNMCNEAFGYCNVKTTWAVRINNNGEFIHENMSNKANFGIRNTSHGCVNMSDIDAKDFYDNSLFGDPVEVSNTNGPAMTEADAVYDWIYSPEAWKARSAVG